MRKRMTWSLGASVAVGTIVLGLAAAAQDPAPKAERKPFSGPSTSARRHSLLDDWKASRVTRVASTPSTQGTGGTAIVGRASMAINDSDTVAYTRQYLGLANNCDVDPNFVSGWRPSTAYLVGDHARASGSNFIATQAGTSGASQPSCGGIGVETTDGSVKWKCEGSNWTASASYTAGMVVRSITRFGFLFQAQNDGTSGATEPLWPTTPGATVVDNTITWKAIGNPQGTFRDCNPMQISVRDSLSVETIIVNEGDAVGNSQVFGWSEHIDMNSSGVVAFKTALAGALSDDDEQGTAVVTAGPGAGTLTAVMSSGETVDGRFLCGFTSMVSINDAGQVLADSYGPAGTPWQPSMAYTAGTRVRPTAANGLLYVATSSGTSGSTEPPWPTDWGATVVDSGVTWQVLDTVGCDTDDDALIRYTPGPGNELLVAKGSTVGGSTVTIFGCTLCVDDYYDQTDGRINSSGHVPVVLSLADGTEGVFLFDGPGSSTQVARTGGSNPYTSISPRATVNDNDQVAFIAMVGTVESLFVYTPPIVAIDSKGRLGGQSVITPSGLAPPPSPTATIVVSEGDDIGTRTSGTPSGVLVTEIGNYVDINNPGNIVFQVDLSDGTEGYYFWDAGTGVLQEIHREPDNNELAPELLTINDSNTVAYVTGGQGYDIDAQEDPEFGGAFFWQAGGGNTPAIQVGDVIGGDTVTGLFAQHHSFARRQFNQTGCLAIAYAVNGDDIWMDCTTGDPTCYTKSPLLFTACAAAVLPYSLTTTASASVPVGGTISDSATLTGSNAGTGTITFDLYGPGDSTCSGSPIFTSSANVAGDGTYSSGNYVTSTPGTYQWIASYSGDVNNRPLSGACGDPGESVIVTAATPGLSTTASGTVTVGGNISDTGTLSGGFNPTGTITFDLYGPGDTTCSAAAIFTSNVPVSGNGAYPSGNYTTTAPGTYRWIATYSGDSNNAGTATVCGDTAEIVTVTPASPAITTSATATAAIGSSISDTATLAGGFNPTGTITFNVYAAGDATCSSAPVFTTNATVSGNGNYTSASFTPSAPGTYRWIASYGGDANNNADAGACNDANESSVITAASPTLTTTASPGVTLGGTVSDSATLAGGFNPTGTITFRLYGPNDATCSSVAVFTSNSAVSGNGTYNSATFTPVLPGTYRWIASYSGDANNNATANLCGDPSESVVVSSPVLATPTITTTASTDTTIGAPISDSATLSGGNAPTGTITFAAYGPNDATCGGAAAFTSNINVAGNGPYGSGAFTPALAGTYRWVATYNGDGNNNPVTTTCNDPNEDVVVSPVSPSIITTASPGVTVGGSVFDTAKIAAGFNPTGTITFRLYPPTDVSCAATPVFTSAVPVSGNGTYTSGSFTTVTTGTFRWTASYSGDANNNTATSPCNAANESVIVSAATPSITTTASPGVTLGGSVSDTATLSGGFNPGGTITFSLFGPADTSCTATPVFTSTVTVSGNGSYTSASHVPAIAGTYRWKAVYSGDSNNASAGSPCNAPNESVTVTPSTGLASPTLTTTASADITVGGTIHDTAVLGGGNAPTGTITFRAYGPINAQCSGTPAFSANVIVNGNGTYNSPPFQPQFAGTYRFTAAYSGDANNNPATSPCNAPNESVSVGQATPALSTTASPNTSLGNVIFDTARISGGFNPQGILTFAAFGPDNTNCAGVAAFTSNVSIDGNGTYRSASFTPTAAGTYRFVVRYRGDINNQGIVSPCNAPNESVLVAPGGPALTVLASPPVPLGGTISAVATLNAVFNPGGTITFKVFGPNDTSCSATPVFTSTTPVSGNGDYSSDAFTPDAIGTYRFVAVYSGDGNNTAVTTTCNVAGSTVEVNCDLSGAPTVAIVGEATTGRTYDLLWTAVIGARAYIVEEATNAAFTDATTQIVEGTSVPFRHETSEPKAWFYRVTPLSRCDDTPGEHSDTGRVVIVPLPPADRPDINVNVPFGSTEVVVQQIFVPGIPGQTFDFVAMVDQPWLTVTPTSGKFPPEGVTFDLAADPKGLPNGTHTGTLIVTLTDTTTAARVKTNGVTTVTTTVSVNLVTPVTNVPIATPQLNSIIIPSLGHLQGATARWQSDIRMLNSTTARQSYAVTFNPSGQLAGTVKSTVISADPGQTIALDDVVRNWFGFGSLDDRTAGFLEIRPLTLNVPKAIASSRTYSLTPGTKGTLGQFIPALSFTDFIGRATTPNVANTILSMQQIAQSDAFRTNVGLVEAAGKPATALMSVFNAAGDKLLDLPVELAAGEQKQLNNVLAQNNITLNDGRVEVQMTAGDGKITAYASVIDNHSGVPLLVSGVPLGEDRSTRYVVPGVADLNTAVASWRTDMRVFNSDTTARNATLVFYPQNNGAPVTKDITIAPREVKTLDDVVKSLFGQTNVGGAVHVTTPTDSALVVSGRTYNLTANGTFGQFIPAVTPAEAVGRGERALQVLQAEDSPRYRTNLGVAEVTGQPVTVEITVTLPDTKATPTVTFTLQPNEFRQFRVLQEFGIPNAYNARISVRAVGGDGRVTAYGSVIDLATESPTFIPAQ